nr:MAG TPA: hypothetical protein [Caudoviricetes sp.]
MASSKIISHIITRRRRSRLGVFCVAAKQTKREVVVWQDMTISEMQIKNERRTNAENWQRLQEGRAVLRDVAKQISIRH